jgi:N-terminal half of MaoC dehydratase
MSSGGDLREPSSRTWVGGPVVRDVTAEDVARFLRATACVASDTEIMDGFAVGNAAPPTYFCPDPVSEAERMGFVRPTCPPLSIDGGSSWEFGVDLRIGDELTLVGLIADVVRRRSHDGREFVHTTVEIRGWNQHGESVGAARGTVLNFPKRRQHD